MCLHVSRFPIPGYFGWGSCPIKVTVTTHKASAHNRCKSLSLSMLRPPVRKKRPTIVFRMRFDGVVRRRRVTVWEGRGLHQRTICDGIVFSMGDAHHPLCGFQQAKSARTAAARNRKLTYGNVGPSGYSQLTRIVRIDLCPEHLTIDSLEDGVTNPKQRRTGRAFTTSHLLCNNLVLTYDQAQLGQQGAFGFASLDRDLGCIPPVAVFHGFRDQILVREDSASDAHQGERSSRFVFHPYA
mmetsp:Transcript_38176/g.151288  ORF Transcript_38176/g.151288 Transcript_38176/m.151288 type:complete len:240 (+) Transcript_38176:223-942(+)